MDLKLKKNELHYYTALIRNRKQTESGNALHNVIRTMAISRNHYICGEDFSHLDFWNIALNSIHFSKDGADPTDFSGSKISELNLVSGHDCTIQQVLFAGQHIISLDIKGNIIVWDFRSGIERYKLSHVHSLKQLLCVNDVLISIGFDGNIAGWDLHSGNKRYHFCVNAEIETWGSNSKSGYVVLYSSNHKFFLFDSISGNLCERVLSSYSFHAEKILLAGSNLFVAVSERGVGFADFSKDQDFKILIEHPDMSFNRVENVKLTENQKGVLVVLTGHIDAYQMVFSGDYKPYSLYYFSFHDENKYYSYEPSIKEGSIDWGDEDGFGLDFDGAWGFESFSGEDIICDYKDNFKNIYLSRNGNSFAIEKNDGCCIFYDAEGGKEIYKASISELTACLSKQNASIKNQQKLYDFPELAVHCLECSESITISNDKKHYRWKDYHGNLYVGNIYNPSNIATVNIKKERLIGMSEDFQYVATVNDIGNMTIYSMIFGKLFYMQHHNQINIYGTYKIGNYYYACYYDELFVWNKNKQLCYCRRFDSKIRSLEILKYNDNAFIITENNRFYILNIFDGRENLAHSFNAKLTCYAIIPEESKFVCALSDGICIMIDFANGKILQNKYPINFERRIIKQIVVTEDVEICLLHNKDLRLACWDLRVNEMYLLPPHTDFIQQIYTNGSSCSGNGKEYFDLNDIVKEPKRKWNWYVSQKEFKIPFIEEKLYPIRNIFIQNCNFNNICASNSIKQMLYQQKAKITVDFDTHSGCRKLTNEEYNKIVDYYKSHQKTFFADNPVLNVLCSKFDIRTNYDTVLEIYSKFCSDTDLNYMKKNYIDEDDIRALIDSVDKNDYFGFILCLLQHLI